MKNLYFFLLSFLLSLSFVHAQRLATEDFNYSPGQLTSVNGGANVSGSVWTHISGVTNPLQVIAGNLSYPGYGTNPSQESGHLQLDTSRPNGEDAFISFDTVRQNTIYISFLLSVPMTDNLIAHDSAGGNYFAGLFGDSSNSAYAGRLYIRKGMADSTYNLGIAAQGYTATPIGWIDNDVPTDSVILVTIAYQIVAGPNDIAKLWINPPNVPVEPVPQAMSIYSSGTKPPQLSRFAFRQSYDSVINAGTPRCEVDAIKISLSWADGTLPLQLLSFSVIDNNGYANLSWQTCNEINVKGFEVQKSADAINFSAIGMVEAKNASCATTYTYYDTKQLSGRAFYRIKMIDKDGIATYSGIVSVDGTIPVMLGVFPNPVTNYLVLMHPKAGENASMMVYDMNGRSVLTNKVQNGAVQTSTDVSKLSKGNYIVVFINGNNKQSLKFVKQ